MAQNKLQPQLMAIYPIVKMAEVYTIGAKKHGARSWEEGAPWSEHVGALLRHLFRWLMGQKVDPEDGQHHLSSVMWRTAALLQLELTHPELNDLQVDPRVAEATLAIFDTQKDSMKVVEPQSGLYPPTSELATGPRVSKDPSISGEVSVKEIGHAYGSHPSQKCVDTYRPFETIWYPDPPSVGEE